MYPWQESACTSAASVDITPVLLAGCISEVDLCMRHHESLEELPSEEVRLRLGLQVHDSDGFVAVHI